MIEFDLAGVVTTEFGVGKDGEGESNFYAVPVDAAVQTELLSMARATVEKMEAFEGGGLPYSPAEKHEGTEYLVVSTGNDMETAIRRLHESVNLPLGRDALRRPDRISSYFARFTDRTDRRLTAIRRATQFKGILKSRLLQVFRDTLKIVEDDVFKLDSDFDLLVDSSNTHIWRPSAFEFLGRLQQKILDAVPDNIEAIAGDIPFVDLANIRTYAQSHPRAARYLASIRTQELNGVNQQALVELCHNTNVSIREVGGRLTVENGSEMGFLEVLDRRRYKVELVPDSPERFRASSRNRIDG